MVYCKKELIAKVKFWFGKEHQIFNKKYIIVRGIGDNSDFAYIFKKCK